MTTTRRKFLQAGSVTMLGGIRIATAQSTTRRTSGNLAGVKALTFDMFGTVVDHRSSIIDEGAAFGASKGLKVDWVKFADAWRAGYAPAMNRVRTGDLPWTKLDGLHRMMLDKLLIDFNITGLTEQETDHLNSVWHRLKPWPDSVSGLTRLKKFVISPLSNGNVSLLTHLSKHARLPWDLIFGCDLARHYKRDKEVYLMAADVLSLMPQEIMMVAAHQDDLAAAHGVGFKTAFVPRPKEGPNGEQNLTPDPAWDIVATDFNDLASKLGA